MPTTPSDVEEFVARHWALAHRLIRARAQWVRDAEQDDARSDGLLALWEAARTHDPSRGPEVPHVIRTVNWRLIDRHRDRYGRADRGTHRLPPMPLLDDHTRALVQPGDPIGARVDAVAVRQVLDALSAKHRDILTAYFLEGRYLADIGRERGVTESRASQLVKEALNAARAIATPTKHAPHLSLMAWVGRPSCLRCSTRSEPPARRRTASRRGPRPWPAPGPRARRGLERCAAGCGAGWARGAS